MKSVIPAIEQLPPFQPPSLIQHENVEAWRRRHAMPLLCVGRVPVVPIHTTAAVCGTVVRSSLGSAGLPQWSKTQAYASNVYYSLLSQAVALDRCRVSWTQL